MCFILKYENYYYMIVKMREIRRDKMRHLMSPLDFSVEELDKLLDLANDIEKHPDKYNQLAIHCSAVEHDGWEETCNLFL